MSVVKAKLTLWQRFLVWLFPRHYKESILDSLQAKLIGIAADDSKDGKVWVYCK